MSLKLTAAFALTTLVAAPVAQNYPGLWSTSAAESDRYARRQVQDAHAMVIAGEKFVFVAGGRMLETNDGTASLTGLLESLNDSSHKYAAKVLFRNRIGAGAPAPAGSPKLELAPAAYRSAGGPIDPDTWRYYLDFDIELTGVEAYEGARVRGTRRGPAFQIGDGASGKNAAYGGSGWFTATVDAQPRWGSATINGGNADFNLAFGGDGRSCAYDFNTHDAAHALWIADNRFLFVRDSGRLVEKADGTAKLTGLVAHADNPRARLSIDVTLGGLVSAAATVPAGSPKLDLPANLYRAGGGDIDPDGWYYYTTLTGQLVGHGTLRGARISLSRTGPAFQIGFGADGKGPVWGGSGWLDVQVTRQPHCGSLDGWTFGDFNLRLGKCDGPKFTIHTPKRSRAGWCGWHRVTIRGSEEARGQRYCPIVFFSTSNAPRALGRSIQLDIGGSHCLGMLRRGWHNRRGNSWHFLARVPRWYRGRTLHFQGVMFGQRLDDGSWPKTDVSSTSYR